MSTFHEISGQERDGGTAMLDYFNARHYSAYAGSFTQPDPGNAGANVMNPQSWNAYGYVLGNPLALVDPSGMSTVNPVQTGGSCTDICFSTEVFSSPLVSSSFTGLGGGGGNYRTQYYGIDPLFTDVTFGKQFIPTVDVPLSSSLVFPAKTGNTCPSVPDHPKSPTLQSNIRVGKALSWLPPGNRLLFFYFNVHNKGPMDYKQQSQTLDDLGRWHPSPYQDFGNFNFGVTGAAANIPLQILLRGAGWAQQQAKTSNPSFGHWYDWNPPYGDDPADQAMIRSGYAAYKNGCY